MESTRFQNGSLSLVKNKTTAATWFFRYRETVAGERVQRNLKIGTVVELPKRRDAENALLQLRQNINLGIRAPETVAELVAHYKAKEVTLDHKAFATMQGVENYLKKWITPKWGRHRLHEVRTVLVEEWLHSLPLAPGSRSKIRNIMSALFNHAIRWEWTQHNPITKVRSSSARLREPDVLTPDEFRDLLAQLETRERAMVMLAGSTGLRRSELFALRWVDIDFMGLQVAVTRAVVQQRIGKVKTPASRKPVPLHASVAQALATWRGKSMYRDDQDFLFPSERLNGAKPLRPDMVLKKIIRPALTRAGITGKVVGWHTFRHSLATNLRSLGVDVKVAQELLRHANSRITMDFYTQAVSSDKRMANARAMELLVPSKEVCDVA